MAEYISTKNGLVIYWEKKEQKKYPKLRNYLLDCIFINKIKYNMSDSVCITYMCVRETPTKLIGEKGPGKQCPCLPPPNT